MKKSIAVLLLLSCLAWQGNPFPPVDNNTFGGGEYLKFRVHYGLITAGYADVKVQESIQNMHSRPCYHIVAKGWTSSGFDMFYKVRDTYESYIDKSSLLSLHFKRDMKEGKFRSFTEIEFDHANKLAIYTHANKKVSKYKVPDAIQDVLSSFYYARVTNDHKEFKIGDHLALRSFLDRKTFGLQAKLLAREVIKVDGQKYKALKFKLMVEEVGLVTDGGKIVFWISDDKNKIPLRVKSDLSIGSIKGDLIEAQGLKHPFDAKID